MRTLCTFIMLKWLHRESSGDGHPMSLPLLGRRERDLPPTTTLPSARPLQFLYWGFATLSPCCLCKVRVPWSSNEVVVVLSSRVFLRGKQHQDGCTQCMLFCHDSVAMKSLKDSCGFIMPTTHSW
mmetsp:Transcript_10790/g.19536  ORF Transcript_10790/g.19536 Transcript_10790/m.19536 type:complete len:125 (+) Transcript_10790:472-846(+)